MGYKLVNLEEQPVFTITLEGDVNRPTIQQMLLETAEQLRAIEGFVCVLFDLTALTSIDLDGFAQAMTVFQKTSPTFKPDRNIDYAIVEKPDKINDMAQFLDEHRLSLRLFNSVDSAVTYFKLKNDGERSTRILPRITTGPLDTLHIIPVSPQEDFPPDKYREGGAVFPPNAILEFREVEGQHAMNITLGDEILIGRGSPHRGHPTIDFTTWRAHEKGVSRTHAKIVRQEDRLQLIDLNSSNGTYLNGRRIKPDNAELLCDGDEIIFGHLRVSIRYTPL